MSRLLLLAALVGAVSALTCYTCDSFLTCNDPRVEYCPISTTCYTLRRNGQVALKGCTAGCSTLPYSSEPGAQCTECMTDKCNSGSQGIVPGQYDQQPNFNNEFLKKRRSIGHGAGVEQRSQIGSGVSGGSGGGYNAYGNNGGVGNHHHDNKHGHQIGHGAQGGGIGGGAAPNRHHRRERSSGTGIGQGVRPRNAAASFSLVPMTFIITRLFQ